MKAHLVPHVVGSDRVFLVSEEAHYLVQGAATVAVVPYLDGRHTLPEIADALADRIGFGEVMFAIAKFQRFGHLADGPAAPGDRPALAGWEAQGLDAAGTAQQLRNARIDVVAIGNADPVGVVTALRTLGSKVRAIEPGGLRNNNSWHLAVTAGGAPEVSAAQLHAGRTAGQPEYNPARGLPAGTPSEKLDPPIPQTPLRRRPLAAELVVVVTDEYLDPALGELDAALRAAGVRYLLVKPSGLDVWVGPLIDPARTGCWSCLAHRLDGNRQVERYLRRKRDDNDVIRTSVAALPWSAGLAAQLVAGAAASALVPGAGSSNVYDGAMVSVHTISLRQERHVLTRRPQCRSCGDPDILLQRDPRIELVAQPVRFSGDGGHRTIRPDETYARLEKHLSRLLGAVSSLRPLNDVDNGITFSYSAGHNFAMPGDNLAMLRRNLRGQSGGKGRTDIQAKVSGMCEAIERYSGVWHGDRPTRQASYADLGADLAVHPEELLLYSPRQYAHRERWNRTDAGRLHMIPDPFREDAPISWSTAWSLTTDKPRLVPAGYAWFGHPDLEDHFYCFSDGNGNAAGNTLQEAILQGFCEICERDSVALWWYNRARRPAFDLDSLGEPYIDELREFYQDMHRSIWVLDLTTDLGIPTFAAISRREDNPVEDVLLGFGAHLDVRIAVCRALTELNQFLPAVIKRHPDGSTDYWEDDPETLNWLHTATVGAQQWLLPDPAAPLRTRADYGTPHSGDPYSGDLATDIRRCVTQAERAGLEVIVLDQSLPDIELNVAKVMVPGLRHFWRRLGPGRLYEVPVALGWQPAALDEDDLNPYSVFF